MIYAAWVTALAALITAVTNGIAGILHKRLDNKRFADQGERLTALEPDEPA